jgi:hypothetical protein
MGVSHVCHGKVTDMEVSRVCHGKVTDTGVSQCLSREGVPVFVTGKCCGVCVAVFVTGKCCGVCHGEVLRCSSLHGKMLRCLSGDTLPPSPAGQHNQNVGGMELCCVWWGTSICRQRLSRAVGVNILLLLHHACARKWITLSGC